MLSIQTLISVISTIFRVLISGSSTNINHQYHDELL